MKKIIYYIDDEPDILSFASGYFGKRNFIVKTFQDGEVVLKAMQSETPDLVMTDFRREGLAGIEFLELLQDTRSKGAKIILVSGCVNQQLNNEVNHLVDGMLSKPLTLCDLLRITNHLAYNEDLV